MAQSQTFDAVRPRVEVETASARWMQLLLGFIVMMTISSPQYVWNSLRSVIPEDDGLDTLRGSVDHHLSDRPADLALAAARIPDRATRA